MIQSVFSNSNDNKENELTLAESVLKNQSNVSNDSGVDDAQHKKPYCQ